MINNLFTLEGFSKSSKHYPKIKQMFSFFLIAILQLNYYKAVAVIKSHVVGYDLCK